MFEPLMAQLMNRLSGSLSQAITQLYGINERELRGSQLDSPSLRRRIQKRAKQALHYEFDLLRKLGMDAAHVQRLQLGRPSAQSGAPSPVADFIHDMSFLSMIAAPRTLELAKAMDRMSANLAEAPRVRIEALEAEPGFLGRIADIWDGNRRDELYSMRDRFDDIPANQQRDYLRLAVHVIWFQLLASWDIEFGASYGEGRRPLHTLGSFPLFSAVLPSLALGAQVRADGTYAARGLFRLPPRRLLTSTWGLVQVFAKGRWPEAEPSPKKLELAFEGALTGSDARGSETPQDARSRLKAIGNGEKKLVFIDYVGLWNAACESAGLPRTAPPCVLYIASQIWDLMFVQYSKPRKLKTVEVEFGQSLYKRVWTLERKKASLPSEASEGWPQWLS